MPQNTRLARAVAFAALALVVAGCEGQPVAAPAAGPVVMAIDAATSVPPPPVAREPAVPPPVAATEIALSYPETGSGRWVFAPGSPVGRLPNGVDLGVPHGGSLPGAGWGGAARQRRGVASCSPVVHPGRLRSGG